MVCDQPASTCSLFCLVRCQWWLTTLAGGAGATTMSRRGTASPCWGMLWGWGVPSLVSPSLCCSRSSACPVSVAVLHAGRGERSLLHPCSVQRHRKAQGLRIWAVLHITSTGLHRAPGGSAVSTIKGKALLQPLCLCPSKTGRGGPGFCRKNHASFAALSSSAAMEVVFFHPCCQICWCWFSDAPPPPHPSIPPLPSPNYPVEDARGCCWGSSSCCQGVRQPREVLLCHNSSVGGRDAFCSP